MIYEDYNYNKEEDLSCCGICNKQFSEGEPVSVIDFPKGPFRIVCKECMDELRSLSLKDQRTDNGIVEPQNIINELKAESKLWRYMDLAKFINMLKNSTLYFSSPNDFEDIYEGAYGELRNKEAWDSYYLNHAKTSIITAPDNCWHNIEEEKLEVDARRLVEQISMRHDNMIFINCWHENEYESEAMWKMYSKNVENAIAIQTNFGELKKQIGEKASIGKVKYIDYSKRFVGINKVYWNKRKAFEFEREVRAIVHGFDECGKNGIEIKIDLKELICNVYVSPYAPSWFCELVKDIIKKYGYGFDVKYSELREAPF
ncbi:hypothetical protein [Aminipila terrae]|uniref:DUF2971 domain-containing protein n=1 Tax=Aminipila terrae TaxID=2697030 RepID=A0A6P1MFY1_9FIRM|nr:hypothetical protein [Aminipila terrae]QHI73610.1 hypothetical protein Ami3637_15610 [Aminipila terrae]